MASDPSATNETANAASAWGGFAPFVQAAFALSKSNSDAATKETTQRQQNSGGGKLEVPGETGGKMPIINSVIGQGGGVAGPLGAGGVSGPLAAPASPINNGMPSALQDGVSGPMQGVTLPATPQVDSLTAPVNHFITGTPNPFGTQSLGH